MRKWGRRRMPSPFFGLLVHYQYGGATTSKTM